MSFKSVIIGISGGVDSAVSALLLKKKGFNVLGVFMKNWDDYDDTGFCSGEKDFKDAAIVCKKLNIPLKQVNFVKDYWNDVFGNFLKDYQNGLTPNPDILCNKYIKFNLFYNYAINYLNADCIATGHYAQSSFGEYLQAFNPLTNVKLLKAEDTKKDQTFFLSHIPQASLQRTMFPIGNLLKSDVRAIAKLYNLDNVSNKRDSTGICFIGNRKFHDFINEYIQPKPGNFIDIDTGNIVGSHNGIHYWTIGQRCNISGCKLPYFIINKDTNTNNILVGAGTDHPKLFTNIVYTGKPYWIESTAPTTNNYFNCEFRFQNTQNLIKCSIFNLNKDNKLIIKLEKSLRALTPGQYAVFYKDNVCLGSARITQPGPSDVYRSDLQKTVVITQNKQTNAFVYRKKENNLMLQ